jgi:hypothetical protein
MDKLLSKIQRWVRLNPDCQLPTDLAAELEGFGLNIDAVIEAANRGEL